MQMELTLLSGRSWQQGASMEGPGKHSEEYQKAVAICELVPGDLEKLGINDGDIVKLSNPRTGVFVHVWARESTGKHDGSLFMPMGLWVNILVEGDTGGTGMPDFNTVKLEVESAPGAKVLTLKELLASQKNS
ncbi:MAG: molybdopterin dinucleotide binding domain-containing protein [Candidatus Heimdallarchaeota archaeon]